MADEAVAEKKEFGAETKKLAEQIVALTLKQAQELADCLKQDYGIEPAGGGVVMAAPAAGAGDGAAAAEEKTSFDVVLKEIGGNKISVIKVVRAYSGLGLKEAKELVDSAPKTVKEGCSKEEAEKIAAEIKEAGGTAELK